MSMGSMLTNLVGQMEHFEDLRMMGRYLEGIPYKELTVAEKNIYNLLKTREISTIDENGLVKLVEKTQKIIWANQKR